MPVDLIASVDPQNVSQARIDDTANETGLGALVLFAIACVVLPILWGVLVHFVFQWLRRCKPQKNSDDNGWPDYQI